MLKRNKLGVFEYRMINDVIYYSFLDIVCTVYRYIYSFNFVYIIHVIMRIDMHNNTKIVCTIRWAL
jgi:hypothetical protein